MLLNKIRLLCFFGSTEPPRVTQPQQAGCSDLAKEGLGVGTGVHNAKAEECTTLYMRQNIKLNIGVDGLHGNQFAKNSPAKIS